MMNGIAAGHRSHNMLCRIVSSILQLGFPFSIVLKAMEPRVLSKGLHACELLVLRPDWRKRDDAMQQMACTMLDIQRPVTKVFLLNELCYGI